MKVWVRWGAWHKWPKESTTSRMSSEPSWDQKMHGATFEHGRTNSLAIDQNRGSMSKAFQRIRRNHHLIKTGDIYMYGIIFFLKKNIRGLTILLITFTFVYYGWNICPLKTLGQSQCTVLWHNYLDWKLDNCNRWISCRPSSFSFLTISTKLIIFNGMNPSMKFPLRLTLDHA